MTFRPPAGRGRVRVNVDVVDTLAARLTERDRYLCRMIHEHRVLTIPQIADLAFDSLSAAQHRLVILYRHRLVDRFRPFRDTGSAPYHYVLDRGGATVLADEQGIDVDRLDYRRSKALGLATNQRLGHLVASNGFFTAAVAQARHTGRYGELAAWWSEARCRSAWGRYARPDGYGQWRYGDTTSAFFLECDMGTEPHQRLAAKLDDYAKLAAATKGSDADTAETTLLFWFHSSSREGAFHLRLRNAAVPVATATAAPGRNPAGRIWRRLGDPDTHRLDLHRALYRTPAERQDDDAAAYGSWDLARDIRHAAETAVDPTWPPRPLDPYAEVELTWAEH